MFGREATAPRFARGRLTHHRARRSAPAIMSLLAACAALLVTAASASAGTSFSVSPDFPTAVGPVTVGQTGLDSSLTIQNTSTQQQRPLQIALSTITAVPTCGVITSSDCPSSPVDQREPGVLLPSSTGVGQSGTACAGMPFDIVNIDTSQDKYSFTPAPPAGPVVLGPANDTGASDTCVINFTVSVIKAPRLDAFPAEAGIQSNQSGGGAGFTSDDQLATGTGSNRLTVNPGTLTIQTQVAPGTIALGGTFHDTATLNPTAGAAIPTGSIRFDVYNNAPCSGTPSFTSTSPLNAAGTGAQSSEFTPTVPGTYHVVATYLGDTNYASRASACDDALEAIVVNAPPPTPPPAAPPCTPPPGPAPPGGKLCGETLAEACTPPPGPAPAGGELCARGTAAIAGRTGCQGTPFRVTVRGRQIASVTFTLDGKRVRRLTKPNRGSLYVLAVNPRTLRLGVHRVLARTTFRSRSGTRARTLRVTFSKCARRASAPAFTG